MIHKFEAKIISVEESTPTVKCVQLSTPDGFSYEPGQFVTLLLPVNGNMERRSYSIAQIGDNWLEICLNKVTNGRVSPKIHSMKVGETMQAMGPLGVFTLKKDSQERDTVFIATGTGVTPFVSMIRALLQKTTKKVTLFAGYKDETEILYDSTFKELQREYQNFKYHITVSRDETYQGEKGRVQQLIEKYVSKDFSGDFYLCGLFDMIKDVGQLLTKQGISKERIIFERYD